MIESTMDIFALEKINAFVLESNIFHRVFKFKV